MSKEIFQIVYASDLQNPNDFHYLFKEEAIAMRDLGIIVDIKPLPQATQLMYRGTIIRNLSNYPKDSRFINNFDNYKACHYLSNYYSFIEKLSIETFFVDSLNEETKIQIEEKGWNKVFIKKDIKALEHIEEGKSIWPQTSFEEMLKLYDETPFEGKFAIRQYIDSQKIIKEEERYWVLNGNIYHRKNKIPDVVIKAAQNLNNIGSKYYTIDATPDFVVEVNPGESSDRHAVNSAELFASWIKKEFVK